LATFGSHRPAGARFDQFHVDLSSNELFRTGSRVQIQEQPFQVLRLLLEADGKVVTREQLRSALWPENTFVDFEHGVNTAVKKLRQALEDSADSPKFIETMPKLGYRLISRVEWGTELAGQSALLRVVPIGPPSRSEGLPVENVEDVPHATRWRWPLLSLGIALLLLAAAGGYLFRSRPQMPLDKLTVSPFTTFPGFEIAPSFSPDGNQIVFSWFGYEKEFQFDLYIKQVGQERVVQLTHHPATFLAAAWSPDGRSIAFMRQTDPEATGIYLISALGGVERKLADITPFGGWDPIAVSWSADGKWVAFSKGSSLAKKMDDSSPEHFSIHLVNVETDVERVLPDPSPDCVNTWQPAFSPDGKYLASVCVLTEGVAKIYAQTLSGNHAREVADARSSEGFSGVAWAKDSQSILYSSDEHLWRVPLAGGKPEKLLFAQDVESVAVARSGNRLAYAQVRHPSAVWQLDLSGSERAGSAPTKLISSTRGDSGARISPDGKYVAFQSWRSGSPEIWVCDRDGTNPIQLTFFGGPQIGVPSWSSDSRKVVFDLRASGNAELYVVNLHGGPAKHIETGTPNASNPFWSANGGAIYFSTEPPDAIWKVPAGGGTALRLTGDGKGRFGPQEGADGKRVFFYRVEGGQGRAWSALADGGDERPVRGMLADVTWVPSSDAIYFIEGSTRHFSLKRFELAAQKIQKVSDLPGLFAIWGATLSPDQHTFLFSGIEHSEGDIVLVEGFQ
jgi:Tol biopolymer transport system component/DNA-binding winged helix-turn-helix (wHTH) protein